MDSFSRFPTRGKYKFSVRNRNGSSGNNGIRTHNHLVCRRTPNHLAKLAKWLWLLICTVHLTVCYYHVTYEFQSEATLYSLPEYQGTTCSKQATYLKFKWRIPLLSLKLQTWRLLQARSSLKFRQTIECSSTLKLVCDMINIQLEMDRSKNTYYNNKL